MPECFALTGVWWCLSLHQWHVLHPIVVSEFIELQSPLIPP
ncbi:hypothetical protein MICAG_1680005 [Microcystis aeruginosa PCC 9808]|uniref:Uncharacterized protein n=1 Tax=Microcystis aeruginosa PCC 9808 TaxID=1160284 RepID=I4HJJ6_MICAE|nr:hypothetical protein MICAG_1680005 [Microcystis aeruginosa PCC 9808]